MVARRTVATGRWATGARACRGFTLAEVLATLVLIGIVVPAVMRGVSVGLMASSHARHVAQAASLAEAKLAELVVTGQWGLATSGGDFSPDWPQYRWTSQTYSLDFATNEIVLEVRWLERDMEQSMVLSTIVYENANMTGTETTTGTTP